MTYASDEKRGVEEKYSSAMTTSNLRVQADRASDADVIICAGWSQSRIGGALLRLHTEWDSSEKPRMATADQFMPQLMEAAVAKAKDGKLTKEEKRLVKIAAHKQTHKFNQNQLALFLERLKALPDVRRQVALQMLTWGMGQSADPITRSDRTESREMDAAMLKQLAEAVSKAPPESDALKLANEHLVAARAEVDLRRSTEEQEDKDRCNEKAVEIIRWWLHQICPTCDGTKFQVVEGTHRHNGKACGTCHGSGRTDIPYDQQGRRVAGWMDQCVERARASIGRRLRSDRGE